MTKWELLLKFFKTKDYKKCEELLHEDFLYLRETTLVNKEEFIEYIKKRFDQGLVIEDLKLICEDKDVLAWRDTVSEEKGKIFETTNIQIWKDDKIWRDIVSVVNVSEA
tara:strand:- start:227 stop:553 length:327 start_codon:yes stop_codon:yes gene_type:complete